MHFSHQIHTTFGEDVPGNQAVIDSLSPLGTYATRITHPQGGDILQENDQHHDLHRVHGDSPRTPLGLDLRSGETPPTSIHGTQFSSNHGSVAVYQEKEIPELGPIRHSDYHSLKVNNPAATRDGDSPSSSNEFAAAAASEKLQEACLLRYFIEELSPWVRRLNMYQCAATTFNMN